MKDFIIPFALGDIPARIRCPKEEGKHPAMLLLHGFTGFKEGDGNMYELLAERLVEQGFVVLQMDFCSCGNSTVSKTEFTLEHMCAETLHAVKYLKHLECVDEKRIGLVGHSMGGRIACVISSDDIHSIVLLNGAVGNKYRAPWFFKENMYRMQEESRLTGKTGFWKTPEQWVEIYQCTFESLENSDTDPILDYKGNLLIVYGEEDPTVDNRVSKELYARCVNVKRDIIGIPGANHTFQAKTLDYTIYNYTMDQFVPWIVEKMKE